MAGRKRWALFAGAGLLLLVGVAGGCQREHERLIKQYETANRPELRASALQRLGELERDEDFHLFLKAAHDSSAVVRRAATISLGRSGDAKAIDTLGELLADPDHDVEAEAARALAHFNTDKSRAYLLNAYGRQDAPARRAIAAALGASLADALRHEAKMLWDRNLRALESGGPAERVAAAEELGRSGRGDAVERLLPLLGNDSVLLAAGAARGLGAARDRRALAPLLGVLKENFPVLREAAADALAALGDPAAVPGLEAVALDGGPSSIAATKALGQLASASEARTSLCKLAAEGNVEVAGLAARLARGQGGCPMEPIVTRLGRGGGDALAGLAALEASGGAAGVEKVLALVEGGDASVRIAAANALAEMDAPQAGPRVLKLLQAEAAQFAGARQKWVNGALPRTFGEGFAPEPQEHEGEPDVLGARREEREKVSKFNEMMAKVDSLNEARAQAVGVKLVDREVRGPLDLVEDLPESADDLLVALAVAAGRLHAEGAFAALEPLASGTRAPVRAAACEGLGALATPESLAVAGKCLDDGAAPVVRGAARGLRRAGDKGVALLTAAVERRSSERAEIVRALGELKAREAGTKIAALVDEGGLESVEAAVALQKIGDPAFAKALAAQLKDDGSQARLEIIEALGALNDASTVDALRDELVSERPDIRAAAARALGKMGYRDPAGSLDALRFDYYAQVRRAAEEALGKGRQD